MSVTRTAKKLGGGSLYRHSILYWTYRHLDLIDVLIGSLRNGKKRLLLLSPSQKRVELVNTTSSSTLKWDGLQDFYSTFNSNSSNSHAVKKDVQFWCVPLIFQFHKYTYIVEITKFKWYFQQILHVTANL